ncbi:2-C-methyl-D-erythritol 4-phosphate cytidylyltransferase [Comamonas sp. Y33R10-2]|nr:2-C-methyl-D-erythritol 4-phosphate cytidylyltransferase [Comamonas sp. Y33R10-2]QXZ11148.1 2-C-methyl-D-erythritol 4-phosphate cytidylyltransferase [Comamonas sp. Y33R10-2]
MTDSFISPESMPDAKANANTSANTRTNTGAYTGAASVTSLLSEHAAVPRCWALIPCAGVGLRAIAADALAPELPKQYQSVAGQPMVMHTLAAMLQVERMHKVLVVTSPADHFWQGRELESRLTVAPHGGATRAETVTNGLQELLRMGASPEDWALVHDAARCLVTAAQVNALMNACLPDAVGGLLALKLPDTLKQQSSDQGSARVAQTVDRSDKWLAQTPQMFRIGALLSALKAAGDAVTDEASAMEFAGHAPLLVPGGAQNFKVTYPDDFALAEAVLMQRRSAR